MKRRRSSAFGFSSDIVGLVPLPACPYMQGALSATLPIPTAALFWASNLELFLS